MTARCCSKNHGRAGGSDHEDLLGELYGWAQDHLGEHEIVAVGHRVVHGGGVFHAPQRIDAALVDRLEVFSPLAPLHQPHNLAAIREIARMAPHLLQVACFDTAFHHAMPAVATRLALPRRFAEKGFGGMVFMACPMNISPGVWVKSIPDWPRAGDRRPSGQWGQPLRDARRASIDTTMGFTALDGLMMGTRSLDPGAVLHLMLQEGMSVQQVEALLYGQSGLLGVSGVSGDMRVLHASADPHAKEAIELFVWTVARHMAALIGSLEGVDGIIFTAGIGENDAAIRAAICARMAWAGIILDEAANAGNAPVITRPDSRIAVRVIPTDEERMIAFHTVNMLHDQQGARA
jgi:acetate kinase